MKYSTEFLNQSHRFSFVNKDQILASDIVGCFYCKQLFTATEITIEDYIQDKNNGTAECPYCHIDSVIGDASGIELSFEFLGAMNEYYFS